MLLIVTFFPAVSQNKPERKELFKDLFYYTTYKAGIDEVIKSGKPALIFFNGHACVNSRKMESKILNNPEVKSFINERFVFVNLYADDRTKLYENEIRYSEVIKREIKIVAHLNWEIQMKYFNSNSQPLFIRLNAKGEEEGRVGYVEDIALFKRFLGM